MEPYENLIHRHKDYDKKAIRECHDTYAALLQHPKDPDLVARAIEQSLPILGRVMATCFPKIKADTLMYEEILERVPHALFLYLISDTFYNKFYLNESSHFGYLWGLFRHEILNALAIFRRSIPAQVPSYIGYPDYYSGYLPAAIELGVFLRQLPETVIRDAENLIRFREGKDYVICLTAIETLVQGKPIPWYALRSVASDYSLAHIEFLVEHARVLVKKIVLQYREEFEQLQSQLDEEASRVKESAPGTCLAEGGHYHNSNIVVTDSPIVYDELVIDLSDTWEENETYAN